MANLRIGLDFAEAISATFSSIESFRACCTYPAKFTSATYLERRYSVLGIRESSNQGLSRIVRNKETIEDFLGRMSEDLLESDGEVATLKPIHDRPGEEILRWRWVSLALPAELLLAAADLGGAQRVRALNPNIRILEPTAHLHVHATAAVPFWKIWTEFGKSPNFDRIRDIPEGFMSVEEWKAWLRRAFIALRVLRIWMDNGCNALEMIFDKHPRVETAMADLRRGRIELSTISDEAALTRFILFQDSYLEKGHLTRSRSRKRNHNGPLADIEFDRRCMEFMRRKASVSLTETKKIEIFRKLWVQLTRIRVMLFRHLVHNPARTGLDNFGECFDRLDNYINANSLRQEVEAALSVDSDIAVEVLELRKAPGKLNKLKEMHSLSQRTSRKEPNQVRRGNPRPDCGVRRSDPKLTWTLHFIRDKHRDRGLESLIWSHSATAEKLISNLRYCPELLKSIRGLDVAGRELSGPLWTVAASLHKVREASRQICQNHKGIQPLRITVHVGEDFRHLLSGLRAIHEPFWWKIMRHGDRVGHASAIGWDPRDWCARHPIVLQPRLERMFDLAWMLDFVSSRRISGISGVVIESAKAEIRFCLQEWEPGNSEIDAREFVEVVRKIGHPWVWEELGGPFWRRSCFEGKHWRLLEQILQRWDDNEDLIEVRADLDGELLEAIRNELAGLLAYWRTPIELNPSSNLLIGELAYPLAQPLFHIDPLDRNENNGLALTLSADDPVCFASSLSDEFAYAWAGLVVGGGESPSYAQEWLERAARTARRAAF